MNENWEELTPAERAEAARCAAEHFRKKAETALRKAEEARWKAEGARWKAEGARWKAEGIRKGYSEVHEKTPGAGTPGARVSLPKQGAYSREEIEKVLEHLLGTLDKGHIVTSRNSFNSGHAQGNIHGHLHGKRLDFHRRVRLLSVLDKSIQPVRKLAEKVCRNWKRFFNFIRLRS